MQTQAVTPTTIDTLHLVGEILCAASPFLPASGGHQRNESADPSGFFLALMLLLPLTSIATTVTTAASTPLVATLDLLPKGLAPVPNG